MKPTASSTTYRVTARRPYGGRVREESPPITVTLTVEHGQLRTDAEATDMVREAVEHLLPPGYVVAPAVEVDPVPVRLSRKQDGG